MATGDTQPAPKPLFIRARDLPVDNVTVHELCTACEKGAGKNSVYGAQLINGLWRVFCQTGEARTTLLMAGLTVRGLAMRFYDRNPYKAVDGDGGQVSTTKLIISDLPMYMPEAEVEEALLRINVDIRSKIMHELARDDKGKLSRFTTGRRFVYIVLPEEPLPKSFDFGIFKPKLYYKEQPKGLSSKMCYKCLERGHIAKFCMNEQICRACYGSGHKEGDSICTLGLPSHQGPPPDPKLQFQGPPPLASQISQAGPSMSPSEDVWPLPSSQVSQCSSVADRSPPGSPPPLDEARSQEVHTPVTSDGTEENHHKKRPISPTSPSDVQGKEHKREKSEVSTNAEDKNTPDSRPG